MMYVHAGKIVRACCKRISACSIDVYARAGKSTTNILPIKPTSYVEAPYVHTDLNTHLGATCACMHTRIQVVITEREKKAC